MIKNCDMQFDKNKIGFYYLGFIMLAALAVIIYMLIRANMG